MSLVRKTFEIVADDLEQRIQKQSIKPGERLPTIDQLAEQFGVGKSTIREALSQLRARGLIDSRQGEGTFVRPDIGSAFSKLPQLVFNNPQELLQLLEVRRLIEGGCAHSAARSRHEDDINRMQDILDNMKAAVDNEELSRLYDIQFHMALAEATKNPFLIKMMDNMSDALNHTIRDLRTLWLYRGQNLSMNLYLEHLSIFDALKAGDPNQARAMVELHLDHVRDALEDYLKDS